MQEIPSVYNVIAWARFHGLPRRRIQLDARRRRPAIILATTAHAHAAHSRHARIGVAQRYETNTAYITVVIVGN